MLGVLVLVLVEYAFCMMIDTLSLHLEYKFMYMFAVRDRCANEEMHDMTSRLAELSTGHGGRHPMPEIELPKEQMSVSSSTSPSQTCLDIDQNSEEENPSTPDHVMLSTSSPEVPEKVHIHIV